MSMFDSCKGTGKKTASADITTVPTLLYGLILVNGGAAATAKVLSGNGGTESAIVSVPGTTAAVQKEVIFNTPVVLPLGLTVTLGGSNAYYYAFYQVYGS